MGLALTVESLDAVAEPMRAMYKAVDTGGFKLDVDGLEDTTGLKTALTSERNASKAAKKAADEAQALLKQFEGIDPVKTRALMAKFSDDEEASLIAAGKVDEVIARRMAKRDAELNKQVDTARAEAAAAKGVAEKFQTRVLDNHIRAAAAKAGLHPFAVEDALLRARIMFSLNDAGDAVQLGSDGQPVLGKDGKTAFAPAEWLEAMKETAPHWFPAGASGGGAGGSGSGQNNGAKTMTRTQFMTLSAAEQAKTAKTHQIVD